MPHDDDDKEARGDTIAVIGRDARPDPGTALLAAPIANTSPLQSPSAERYPNRWHKGQSGNPNGRPLGSRHRATLLAESLLDGQSEQLIQKTIELALGGDTTALRICIDRIIAPRRDRPTSFRLPPIRWRRTCGGDGGRRRCGSGRRTDARRSGGVCKVIDVFRSTIETAEFERRLMALEEARNRGR